MAGTRHATPIGLVLAFAIAGCDSGDERDSLTKDEYVPRSNEICTATERKAEAVFKREITAGRPSASEGQRFMARGLLPALRENLARRRKLSAPEGDEEEIAAIVAAGERAVAGFEHIAVDRRRVAALFAGAEPDSARRYDALSAAYGIEECSGSD